ncbi:MAG: hypothetical protein J7639_30585, partial [Paenibacillaceae bacterium]|nr:hypothetical protein [Paenibacillaceae bacterium]
MKQTWKWLGVACVAGAVAIVPAISGNAKSSVDTVTAVVASDIHLRLNGEAWQATDTEGNVIYPVVIDGVSYLPVRSLAQALDTNIDWEEDTRTIVIGAGQHAHPDGADGHSHAADGDHPDHSTPPPLTALPVGDGKVSTDGPKVGYVYVAKNTFTGDGSSSDGDWFNGDGTYDNTKKPVVDGHVLWNSELTITVEGDKRIVTGNKLPDHPTGNYPVAR